MSILTINFLKSFANVEMLKKIGSVYILLHTILLYTKQNTDRMLKFDWLRAGPYACVRTGVWTG